MNAKSPTKKFSQQTRFFVVAGVVGVLVLTYFFYQAFGGAVLGVTLTTNPALENGLLAHWSFDAGTFQAGTINDISGNGRHLAYGSCQSTPVDYTIVETSTGTTTFTVPTGVTSITIKAWGAGGGSPGAAFAQEGTAGGGGGFAQSTITVAPHDSLSLIVGAGGGGGGYNGGGGGGGGGGFSAVHKDYTYYVIAGGGGGSGAPGAINEFGGTGGAGGGTVGQNGTRGEDNGCTGTASGVGDNGDGGTSSAGGAGGSGCNSSGVNGTAGSSYQGGTGGAGGTILSAIGLGGSPGGGDGGPGNFAGGGGGGYYGGGGGEGATSTVDAEGSGGGGGGSSYATGTATSTLGGSREVPGNISDENYAGDAGQGGATSTTGSVGNAGNSGRIVLTYTRVPECVGDQNVNLPITSVGTTTWVVPAGVTSVTVKAWGGGGGSGSAGTTGTQFGGRGGGGGFSQTTLAVTPGEQYSVLVGGGGGGGSGFALGGGGGGAGGGYSGIHKSFAYYLVAGGGGGGGASADASGEHGGGGGAGGGTTGSGGTRGLDLATCAGGSPGEGDNGDGGTPSAGGSGGAGCSSGNNGTAGTAFTGGVGGGGNAAKPGGVGGVMGGGDGGLGTLGAGGGGGGCYGGGGAERGLLEGSGGGGGGSSYASGTATSTTGGSDRMPGNNGDSDYAGTAGEGVVTTTSGGADGAAGSDGLVVLSYTIIEGNGSLSQTQGTIGQGSSFDGLTGVASSTSAINNVKTIAFWARPTTTTQNILELGPSGKTVTLASGVVTTGLASPTVYVDGVQTTTFPDTNWHHVVITTGTAVNATTFQIGVASSTYYGGSLDDVRLYSRALAQSEITRLYQLGATTKVGVTLDTNPANANGLVAWWTLDGVNIDLSNNTGEIRDRSGQGNNGDWKNHASTTAPGTVGQAISFDGIDDYVATSSGTTIASVQSIAFWMRIATSTATQKVLNLQGQGTIRVNTNASGQLIVTGLAGSEIMYIDGVATTTALASSAVNTSWHHVVITTGTSFTVNNLTLGRVTTQYFGGSLDDVRLYTRLLSPAEVLRLYQLGATTRVGVSLKSALDLPAGLVGWWTFDGKDIDSTGNPPVSTDTGWQFPGSDATNLGSGNNWTSLTNNKADDGSYVTTVAVAGTTKYLTSSNFDMSAIPNNATIDGVEVKFERVKSAAGSSVAGTEVKLVNEAGTISGNDLLVSNTTWTTTPTVETYGGATELWGMTLTPAIVKDIDFGFVLAASVGSPTPQIDYMQLKVYYTIPSTTTYSAIDRSDSGIDGALTTYTQAIGPLGQALSFNGTSDYVNIGDAGSGIKTIAFWIKPDVRTSKKVINIDGTKQIELNASSQVAATGFPAATVYVDGVAGVAMPDTNWHHVVITDSTGVSATTLELGRVGASYFDGVLDDVRLYTRVLSTAEISRLYKIDK